MEPVGEAHSQTHQAMWSQAPRHTLAPVTACLAHPMQVWFEMHTAPSPDDMELLEAVLSSWFMIGRLGGYNAMNLQVLLVISPAHLNPFPCYKGNTWTASAALPWPQQAERTCQGSYYPAFAGFPALSEKLEGFEGCGGWCRHCIGAMRTPAS